MSTAATEYFPPATEAHGCPSGDNGGDTQSGEQTPQIVLLPISSIRETPENWTIYRKADLADPTFKDLCASIRKNGITSPLEISADQYLISGHRRIAAAKVCGLAEVPCIIDDRVVMADLSPSERISLLTERNAGIRIKSDSELYLEAAAGVDPEAAIRKAEARKAQVFNKANKSGMREVKSVGDIHRTDPDGERAAMLKLTFWRYIGAKTRHR